MPNNTRSRLLAVLEILRKDTNEEHTLTANDIIAKLRSQYEITADRRAVYEDIEAITGAGFDISTYSENGQGYYLREAEFEFSELRLLVDAVLSARFISVGHSRSLIDKIKKLTNKYDEKRLERVNFLSKRVKTDNAAVFYTIDVISEAIENGKQIQFKYLNYNIKKDMVQRDSKKRTVSPYGVIWMNDYYYLVARYSWLDNLTHFRIDKIKDVKIDEQVSRSITDLLQYRQGFDIAEYTNKRMYMFAGEEERITLKCSNEIMHDIIERFGENVSIHADEEGYFIANVKGVRKGLLYFVFQFTTNIEVFKPADFRQQVKERIEAMARKY